MGYLFHAKAVHDGWHRTNRTANDRNSDYKVTFFALFSKTMVQR
jgi:hypothetical protein